MCVGSIEVLAETYRLLDMYSPHIGASHRIWDHDRELLDRALAFYENLTARIPERIAWPDLDAALRGEEPAFGFDDATWTRVRAAHAGHQLGLDILALLPLIASRTGFYDLRLNDDLTVDITTRAPDAILPSRMVKMPIPAPQWFKSAPQDASILQLVGSGPYRLLASAFQSGPLSWFAPSRGSNGPVHVPTVRPHITPARIAVVSSLRSSS